MNLINRIIENFKREKEANKMFTKYSKEVKRRFVHDVYVAIELYFEKQSTLRLRHLGLHQYRKQLKDLYLKADFDDLKNNLTKERVVNRAFKQFVKVTGVSAERILDRYQSQYDFNKEVQGEIEY